MTQINLKLNDLLGLNSDEILNSKINLNMTSNGVPCIDIWLHNNDDVGFSYWSHRGELKPGGKKKPSKNFNIGNVVFGFVKLGENRWLLVTVGKITEVPEATASNPFGNYCSYEIIKKYIPLFGRLIINLRKGNKFSRYSFNMNTFIDETYVEQILPVKYGIKPFPGYLSINIGFSELKTQIEDLDWKSKLSAVSGVYLITDKSNNKKYVGSAYGGNGIYGRWRNYLDNGYDTDEKKDSNGFPNKQLRQIANDKEKGLEYIRSNFVFSILEVLPSNLTPADVVSRENHWKEVLNTRNNKYGYNSN